MDSQLDSSSVGTGNVPNKGVKEECSLGDQNSLASAGKVILNFDSAGNTLLNFYCLLYDFLAFCITYLM